MKQPLLIFFTNPFGILTACVNARVPRLAP